MRRIHTPQFHSGWNAWNWWIGVAEFARGSGKVSYPAADQIGNLELTATIMHSLIDIPKLRQQTQVPPEWTRFIAAGAPIKQLM